MYYHHRPLRWVIYGKVTPPPEEVLDPDFSLAYRWLGQYCGFSPQIWLSRSTSMITGFRQANSNKPIQEDGVLFGFESIQGFPLAYELWCEFLRHFLNFDSLMQANKAVAEQLEWRSAQPEMCEEPVSLAWLRTRDVQGVLSEYLFVEHDQVVVPSLNLKAAKLIICRNERQKKALRRMGFIEDRLVIRGQRQRW